ncbi:class I SAM-dependent methyltransferase [Chitinophaga pendula]|uniref:class I SAM-dependent methyltransferase n=1 Tax=Chitinophaga TaxID=79328 RepID=UPI000BAF666E|nr:MULTISPECIES: class I SAM-dependent methyltransferase [Chitinophaga]ASZ13882.1 SAM-dependent methyltransferase [Chitinophaga sp. MD30]UCJ08498.1 class I SAM-dependent methyltransferase [Chitinophaga pendula]
MNDSTTRFTNRADNYARYRPGYPIAVIEYLQQKIGLHAGMDVADIGAGTGISSELFLKNGNTVYAVEPNDAMRAKATALLQHYPGFQPVKGTAEATQLEDGSMDIVFAGQAFHWFNQEEAKTEFKRIAKRDGYVLLMWNIRKLNTGFAREYENLLATYGTGYTPSRRDVAAEDMNTAFFSPCRYEKVIFENSQELGYETIKGRLLSTSFMPSEADINCAPMIARLEDMFGRYEKDGRVSFDYITTLFIAKAHC